MEWKHVFMAVIVSAALRSSESADAMNILASGFLSVMDECKKELNLDDTLTTDLYKYWKLEFSFLHRETGCAIYCMTKKLNLLAEDGKLHHENTKEYALKKGAAEELANKMMGIILSCEAKHEHILDDCWRVLEMAKCFRVCLHELHWEPRLDVIITEVLTEI